MGLIIAVDLDNTIADHANQFAKYVKKIYSVDLTFEEMVRYDLGSILKEKYARRFKDHTSKELAYTVHTAKNFFLDMEPLPWAIETIQSLAFDGHHIVFNSYSLWGESISWQKVQWLKRYFPKVDYDLMLVEKMRTKKFINAHILVDDDPKAIEVAETQIPILIRRPWNGYFSEENPETRSIGSITELPVHVDEIEEQLLDNLEELSERN